MVRIARISVVALLALSLLAVAAPALAVSDAARVAAGGVTRVKMVDGNDFRPATVTIPRRSVVKWVNRDNVSHTSTSSTSNSGTVRPGESFKKRFRRAGTYDYRCTIHVGMTGTVVVS